MDDDPEDWQPSDEQRTFHPDVEQAWTYEIRRRLRDIREGHAVMRDWEDVLADIRSKLKATRSVAPDTSRGRDKPRSRT
jgi:hypothetical protein